MTLVKMVDITKRFHHILANDHIDFEVERGEVHALVGENGAGKTTLMKILMGLYKKDEGEIYFSGRKVEIKSPRDALKLGIYMVHQHFALVNNFSVLENLLLGLEQTDLFLSKAVLQRLEKKISEVQEKYNLRIDLHKQVKNLSMGERQKVELLKAMLWNSTLLILDEPTSMLTPQEIDNLLEIIQRIVKDGSSVVLVTHKLREVMHVSDRVTVLRRGKKVGEFKTSDINERELSRLMVGFAVNSLGLKECFGSESVRESKNNEILRVENVSALSDDGRMALKNVSLSINEGEILGVAGVAGNGQKELVEVIMGLRKVLNGRILLCGKDVTNRTPMDLRKMGVAYVPEDRFKFGIIPSFTIRDNLVLVAIANFSKRLILNYSKIDDFARELIFKLKINPEDPYIPIEKLSGGNLQKVILARELYSYSNKLILLHEPTAGLDVATVQFIHDQILSERKNKKAVLFVSGDLDEIFKLSDRIVVMYSGEIVGRFSSKGGFDRYRIGELMMGVGGYSSP